MTGMAADEEFAARTDPMRRELLAYCYRMLGSVQDAEDLLQETLLRAWLAYDRYDPARSSLRTWLYRIATNACLTALQQRNRRPLPSGLGTPASEDPRAPMVLGDEVPWLQPFPDARAGDPADTGSLRLALVAALQFLPARQRAVLILREVLEWSAAEVATALDTTPAAVNSALQRARAQLGEAGLSEDRISEPAEPGRRELVDRYVTAFRNADLATLQRLLTESVVLEMPPMLAWYSGRAAYAAFIARVYEMRGTDWRMEPVGANGQPAVAAYVRAPDGGYLLHTLQVFTVTGGAVSRTTVFQDPAVFVAFALPATLSGP